MWHLWLEVLQLNKISFAITGINYILKNIKIENNNKNISQYLFFDQMNATLVWKNK